MECSSTGTFERISQKRIKTKIQSGSYSKGDLQWSFGFYVDYGFASSIYDDWFWKIFYEKGSKGNKFSIWISDLDVYEE